MSARRAEIRRIQRNSEKSRQSTQKASERTGIDVAELERWQKMERERIGQELDGIIGCEYQKRYEELIKQFNQVLDKRTEAIIEDTMKGYDEIVLMSNRYIAFVNSLLMLKAIHKTWGFTKCLPRFLEIYNQGLDEVYEVGVEATLEEVNGYGLDIGFDSFEIEDFLSFVRERDVREVMGWLKEFTSKREHNEVLPNVV